MKVSIGLMFKKLVRSLDGRDFDFLHVLLQY